MMFAWAQSNDNDCSATSSLLHTLGPSTTYLANLPLGTGGNLDRNFQPQAMGNDETNLGFADALGSATRGAGS